MLTLWKRLYERQTESTWFLRGEEFSDRWGASYAFHEIPLYSALCEKKKLRYWLLYEGDHLLAQKGNIQTFREFTVSTLSYDVRNLFSP